jgi:hypothetical protein
LLCTKGGIGVIAVRYENSNTTENLSALVGLISSPGTVKVTLFASPAGKTAEMSQSDGPETNLPLVSAVVEYEIPKIETVAVVFDGLFLTAARYPRYGEVRHLLDIAEQSNHVFFSEVRAPFTSSVSAEDAALTLQSLAPVKPLTPETRADYFSLLSSLSEAEYRKLYA